MGASGFVPDSGCWMDFCEPEYNDQGPLCSLLLFIHEYFGIYRFCKIFKEETDRDVGKSGATENGLKIP